MPRAARSCPTSPPPRRSRRWLAEARRVEAVELDLAAALGRVTAAPVWALRSSPAYDAAAMDGIAVRAADTVGASRDRAARDRPDFALVDTGDALPEGFDAVVMREHVHWEDDGPEVRGRGRAVPARAHDRRGRQRDRAAAARGPPAAPGRPGRGRRGGSHGARGAPRAARRRHPPTGDEVRPLGADPAPGELVDTNSLMLAAQATEIGCTAESLPIVRDDPALIGAALRAAAARADLVIVIAGSSAGRDDHTAAVVAQAGHAARPRRRGPARPSGRPGPGRRHRPCSARRAIPSPPR